MQKITEPDPIQELQFFTNLKYFEKSKEKFKSSGRTRTNRHNFF